MKRYVYLVLTIIWIIVIFLFSSQSGSTSSDTSHGFVNSLVNIYEKVSGKDVDNELIVKKLNHPVRKTAHFVEFFILGVLVFLFINTFDINKKIIISILFCFIIACCDEFHQMFSINRGPGVIDVLIDTFGGVTAIVILGRKIIYDYFKKA